MYEGCTKDVQYDIAAMRRSQLLISILRRLSRPPNGSIHGLARTGLEMYRSMCTTRYSGNVRIRVVLRAVPATDRRLTIADRPDRLTSGISPSVSSLLIAASLNCYSLLIAASLNCYSLLIASSLNCYSLLIAASLNCYSLLGLVLRPVRPPAVHCSVSTPLQVSAAYSPAESSKPLRCGLLLRSLV